ncbi:MULTISPECIES: Npun_F5749 family FMN-dependent PPOX-type flavoprotein [Okeania]|uniref:Pyridoxamine 5'-phosphate oxidase n=1 Tax=Okeania hirsuta TaxID=1458930 RepID=A0A3N6P1W9_9CYAN|nr:MULTISPECIES: Npun_F5749 family FMN-dependent PPOX-type flavoprotein [Okeania]NEP03843.1 pyridoxamine 5'-phosphate oxidase [Okeania sp. SIO4D6]NEP40457.1 pyridoxamine 5'-phosphate oxidase [Okeania sp. SIO2H7]NET13800.1 pyridoxamine 5'-phosphate oxidase [Okeania sp. SIO1H6]NEP73766.1 pyridoxamine 5'-phosphate oxidase [Okeania sp. SIO2G5]NEP94424.1 pyridoxamine 5'-phosphate oxidase [Okeania sp. SIO2F5]
MEFLNLVEAEKLAPWRSPLARALHRNRSLTYARYVQLATVTAEGQPKNRTIVFRGFLEETNQLKFITDSRSNKVEQIEKNPWAEICWYFPKTREQFRLTGKLYLIKANNPDPKLAQVRETTWQEISDNARQQFTWPNPGESKVEIGAFELSPPNPAYPLSNFYLLLLNPTKVEHLELKGEPQNRWLYQIDNSKTWSTQDINP